MVEILLATYNGERYIRELLDSLLTQTFTEWVLTVQDDLSTDDTVLIVKEYLERYPNKIRIIQNSKRFGNAKDNFFSLISQSTGQYVMLCDQDDVWLNNKIEITLEKIRRIEKSSPHNTPVLVHTDLTVVDEKLNSINASLFDMQNMDENRIKLCNLVVQNIITGCTVMINRPLVELMNGRFNNEAVMHDWWMGLLACCFGEIGFVDMPTILYRQHGENSIGAKNTRSWWYRLYLLLHLKQVKINIANTYVQAQSFFDIYGALLSQTQYNLLERYIKIPQMNKISRCFEAWRLGVVKRTFLEKIASILYL